MAYELLQKRGVYKELGKQWVARFLARHPELKSKYVNPIEKERILATDPAILQHYFELYKSTKEHGIWTRKELLWESLERQKL
ncbi:HTH CenpB-type DNA-binding domain [Lasallia pustulata]|uniref:HTH CenpB-type DNA-binding domain n=1 Tax=Lasallia pustulata TaxID=136370 RepID=A0A1W5D122_9LECA|nr:HTH CenpB-type DNA-binding domain [Lasallia pustulata]